MSLVVSAALAAVSDYLKAVFPGAEVTLQLADVAISAALLTGLFAAIYKVLPDTPIAWRDVVIGALATAGLFEGGKYVIALYIGKSDIASSYGAAGALIILLLWIFYSAQIFLLGAARSVIPLHLRADAAPGIGADVSLDLGMLQHVDLDDAAAGIAGGALLGADIDAGRHISAGLERHRR